MLRTRNRWLYRPTVEWLEERSIPAVLPAGFMETAVAAGLTNPTAMEFAPDGRLFITEQGGTMEVFANGVRQQSNFFRDTPLTVDPNGERGLLGIAFDPNFAVNRFVYVYYTATTPAVHNRVSRFTANATGDLAVAGSEVPILDLNNLSGATNHNGGAIHFGLDGKLYIGVGENANPANSQTLGNLLGKVLRINADGSIPTDNPFFNTASGINRAIWALGLRNPFTFAVQPGTGRIFINDVGAATFEEINDGRAGANYGWPTTEGPTNNPNFVSPLFAYDHSQGCCIAGGAFYNPATPQFPSSFTGNYFFADLCGGWIHVFDPATGAVRDFATGIIAPVDLKVTSDGSLYYLSRGTGQVFRVQFPSAPTPGGTPSSAFVGSGADAGGGPLVNVYDAGTGALRFSFFAYATTFTGGVRVAIGDVNRDGTPDIITGAGPGGGPQVRVFDGTTGQPLAGPLGSFFGINPSSFTGGVWVAAGDINGDGFADVIVGADAGGGPQVTAFSGRDGSVLLGPFNALPAGFTGGVRVAAGDVNGDGFADIIAAAGRGGGPQVALFNGATGAVLGSFFAFAPTFTGGVYVAAGRFNADALADIIAGAGAGAGPQVTVFDGGSRSPLTSFYGLSEAFRGGVRVGETDRNGDGLSEILTGAGPGGGPQFTMYDSQTLALLESFFAYAPQFSGGIFVAGR